MASESMPWGERFLIGGLAAVAALVGMAACDPEADAAPLTEPAASKAECKVADQ